MNPNQDTMADEELDQVEKLLLTGIQAREREMVKLYIEPFQADLDQIFRMIEGRHGLPVGAIGSTHKIDEDFFLRDVSQKEEFNATSETNNG